MALLHSSWKPQCAMERVILHWTAGVITPLLWTRNIITF